jgi:hypothetical protein
MAVSSSPYSSVPKKNVKKKLSKILSNHQYSKSASKFKVFARLGPQSTKK